MSAERSFVSRRGSASEAPPQLRLFDIPIRVEPGFLIVAALLGCQGGVSGTALWMVVILGSLLAHELAHALVARRFGAHPSIALRAYGGVTLGVDERVRGRKRALVALAGPGVSLALAAVAALVTRAPIDALRATARVVLEVNLVWAALSLLPMRRLDGGALLRALLDDQARRVVAMLALVVIGSVGLGLGLGHHDGYALLVCGVAGMGVGDELTDAINEGHDRHTGLHDGLRDGEELLAAGDVAGALRAVEEVLRSARSAGLRARAHRALLAVHVARRDPVAAARALAALPHGVEVDVPTLAELQDLWGRSRDARVLLECARRVGGLPGRGAKLLIDLYARDGYLAAAVRVAVDCANILTDGELMLVAEAAERSGVDAAALREVVAHRGTTTC